MRVPKSTANKKFIFSAISGQAFQRWKARLLELTLFAEKHGLPLVTIKDLITAFELTAAE